MLFILWCTPQSTHIYSVQSSVWRLPNCWHPTPSPPSECVLPPPPKAGGGSTHSPGGEGVGGQYFGRRQTLDWPLTVYSLYGVNIRIPCESRERIRTYIGSSSFLSADKEGWGQVTGKMRPPRPATYINLLTSVQNACWTKFMKCEKDCLTRWLLMVSSWPSQSTFMNAQLYSTYDYSRNDKYKQILSQCKLVFSGRNIKGSANSEEHQKKYKNQARRLFWPRSIHLCHQKPNPARGTVPLMLM